MAIHVRDVLKQGKCRDRRNRIRRKRGVGGKPDKAELGQRTGRSARRRFPFEPRVGGFVMNVRRPSRGKEQVEIQEKDQGASSYRFTRSRVSTVPSRETSNTGKPLRFRKTIVSGRNPRRARSESTVPTERFRSPAIDLAASGMSFSVIARGVDLNPRPSGHESA